MKNTLFKIVLSVVLLLVTVGCSDKKPSIDERKTSFDANIGNLKDRGFDINRSSDSRYILTVKEPKTAALYMLSLADMATLDTQALSQISEAIDGSKVGIEVDWQKYASGSEDSVFVYYLGNGKEPAHVKSIFENKKLGAYLTFDGDGVLKSADIKDIDEKIIDDTDVAHLYLKGAGLKIDKAPTKDSPRAEYTINGGELKISFSNKSSTDNFSWGYKGLACDISRENSYLGKWSCRLPQITIAANETKQKESLDTVIKDTHFEYEATSDNGKIKADMIFEIPSVDVDYKGGADGVNVHLKDLKISGDSSNLDEKMMREIYGMAGSVPKDHNETFVRYMKLVGEFMGSGITFDFRLSLASVDGKSKDGNKTIEFALKDYQGEVKGSLDKTINYQESAKIVSIQAAENSSKDPLFELKNFKFGYSIKDLYNFLPEFMEFAAMSADKAPDDYGFTKEEEAKLEAMGHKIVNGGLGVSLKPVGLDSLKINDGKSLVKMDKIELFIDAILAKNDLKLDSPMAAMMLMQYLQADGKLELSKKDLDQMSVNFPPEAMAMVIMYAKYEGDKAIFEVKFDKGRLMINGKPVM